MNNRFGGRENKEFYFGHGSQERPIWYTSGNVNRQLDKRKELGRKGQVGFLNLGLYRWSRWDYMDKSSEGSSEASLAYRCQIKGYRQQRTLLKERQECMVGTRKKWKEKLCWLLLRSLLIWEYSSVKFILCN